ncbi:MAG: hypothetical protein K8E24_012445, partial [Methanobacterium paludis]|nr:hypothetical protein [Methanobacterium paludis]
GTWKDTNQQVSGTALGFMLLLNPIGSLVIGLSYLQSAVNELKNRFSEWAKSKDGQKTLGELAQASKELQDAWNELYQALVDAWTELQPSLSSLWQAFQDLWNAIAPTPEAKQAADAITGVGSAADGSEGPLSLVVIALKLFIWMIQQLIPWVKALAWFITTVIVPAIKIWVQILKAQIWVLTQVINGITWLCNAFKKLWPYIAPVVNSMGRIVPMAIIVYEALHKIVCIIIGCSPGMIPAMQQLVAYAGTLWPQFKQIIIGALNSVIPGLGDFIATMVGNMQQLPGKIFQALGSLPGLLGQAMHDAYLGAISKLPDFYSLGQQIKDKVVSGITDALGIGSPSKVTYGLGEFISQGLVNGMKDWVNAHISEFSTYIKDNVMGGFSVLVDAFKSFQWVDYWDSRQSITTTLQTMTGNCYDAALAFQSLSDNMGVTAELYRTFVNGIAHIVINLPSLKAWIDPSGILGTGLHSGTAPGSPAGSSQTNIYVNNPIVREDQDINKLTKNMARQILNSGRYGV